MYQLNKTSNLITLSAETPLAELKRKLSKEGLYFGYHPLLESDETLDYYLRQRIPNLYHFKFGSLSDLVSSMTFELKSGMHFHLKDAPRAAIGPDFNRLLVGTNGRFGRIHDVSLRLTALPERIHCASVAIDSRELAQALIVSLIGLFIKPLFFKYFPHENVPAGLRPPGHGTKSSSNALIVALSGMDEMVRVEEGVLQEHCERHGHNVKWLDITESRDLMNRSIFNNQSYEDISKQYREFLWPPFDSSHQLMVEKKIFET